MKPEQASKVKLWMPTCLLTGFGIGGLFMCAITGLVYAARLFDGRQMIRAARPPHIKSGQQKNAHDATEINSFTASGAYDADDIQANVDHRSVHANASASTARLPSRDFPLDRPPRGQRPLGPRTNRGPS